MWVVQAAEKEKSSQGRVVAIGEGRTSSEGNIVPCHFKPGDNVKFLEYAPVEIKVENGAAVPPGSSAIFPSFDLHGLVQRYVAAVVRRRREV